jgi:hypothetical protein
VRQEPGAQQNHNNVGEIIVCGSNSRVIISGRGIDSGASSVQSTANVIMTLNYLGYRIDRSEFQQRLRINIRSSFAPSDIYQEQSYTSLFLGSWDRVVDGARSTTYRKWCALFSLVLSFSRAPYTYLFANHHTERSQLLVSLAKVTPASCTASQGVHTPDGQSFYHWPFRREAAELVAAVIVKDLLSLLRTSSRVSLQCFQTSLLKALGSERALKHSR